MRIPALSPEQRAIDLEQRASKPRDLPSDQAAAVAAAGAVVDKLFRDAKRKTCGTVLGAYIDAKKGGTGYDLDAIVRETVFGVAKETGVLR